MAIATVKTAKEAFDRLDRDPDVLACVIPLNMNGDLARLKDMICSHDLNMRIMDDGSHTQDVQRLKDIFNKEAFLPVKFIDCDIPCATPMALDLASTFELENKDGETFRISDAFADEDYDPHVTDFFFRAGFYDGGGNELHRDRGYYTMSLYAEGDATVLKIPDAGNVTPKAPCLTIYRGLDNPHVRKSGDITKAALHKGQPNSDGDCAGILINLGPRRQPGF